MRQALLLSLLLLPRSAMGQGTAGSSELSVGDSLRITVWRSPELSGDFVVGPDGTITHPLYRAVKVAGVPMTTVQNSIARFLTGYQENAQFVIEPLIRVGVSGEVTRPQIFGLRPETSVAQAVIRAGGLTQNGKWERVRLIRSDAGGSPRQIYFDLRNPADPIASGPVRSGDLIVVDRKKSLLKDVLLPVLGLVGSIASVGLLIERTSR